MKQDNRSRVLIVGPVLEDCDRGFSFDQFAWRSDKAANCLEAFLYLRQNPRRVIVCERDLPDGTWQDVLDIAANIHHSPPVIVTSRLADDHLWAEVLNLGGYDVLAKPLDRREVDHSVNLAWEHWLYQLKSEPKRKGDELCLTA